MSVLWWDEIEEWYSEQKRTDPAGYKAMQDATRARAEAEHQKAADRYIKATREIVTIPAGEVGQ